MKQITNSAILDMVLTCGLGLGSLQPTTGSAQVPAGDTSGPEGKPTATQRASFEVPRWWEYSAPLIGPEARASDPSRAQKDPSVVFYGGRWHVFMTVKLPGRSAIEYCSFKKWEEADASQRTILRISTNDYYCAPQVFYFRPHQKWYLVYQMGVPGAKKMWVAYSTTAEIADPNSWTQARPMLDGGKEDPRMVGGLDYWIICDDQRAYLFLTSLDGKMWRLWTRLADFPRGFDHCELALEAKVFEASHTYKLKGMDQYLTVIEENGRRYYKAYLADRLDGKWTPVADTAERPFAGWRNIRPAAGVEPWTDNISHGELIRDGWDETLTVDPSQLRFLFQGLWDKDKSGKGYGQFQWRIGLLTPASSGAGGGVSSSARTPPETADSAVLNRVLKYPMAFPGTDWVQASPESQGVDPARLQAAIDYLARSLSEHGGVDTVFIVRNGCAVWQGPGGDREFQIYSATKSFTSTMLGLLIDDGKVSLSTLATEFEPALAERYSGVTLRHFATMTSGYDSKGGSYEFDAQGRGDSWNPGPPAPPIFPPGTRFRYWDDAMSQFGHVLTKAAGQPLDHLFKTRIADPIGMTRWRWTSNDTPTGRVLCWTGGLCTSARELARFGHLFLNRGNWNGRQLISASWVHQATSVQVPSSIPNEALPRSRGAGVYGFNWWANGTKPDGKRLWPGAPPRTFYANGLHNNVCIVVPEWKLVLARTNGGRKDGSANTPVNTDEIWSGFFSRFSEAIGP